MKSTTQLRRTAAAVRTRRGPITDHARLAIPVAGVLTLVASALLVGATFATAMAVLPTTVPTLLVGWILAIGLTFALPLAVVRGMVALVERTT
jgi:hypothetical protein